MKHLFSLALLTVLWTLATLSAQAAGKPVAAPEAAPAPPPKSVFVIDPKFGKDPFFPTSIRLVKAAPQLTNDVATPPPPPMFPDEFRCQGISALAGKRLAIVNGRTFEVGESYPFRLSNGHTVHAKCLEIRDASVVLEVNGITKELHLRANLK